MLGTAHNEDGLPRDSLMHTRERTGGQGGHEGFKERGAERCTKNGGRRRTRTEGCPDRGAADMVVAIDTNRRANG